MTAHLLQRLEAPGDLIVEGGFTRSRAFGAVLAALMPGRRVVVAPSERGGRFRRGDACSLGRDGRSAPAARARARLGGSQPKCL